MNDKLIFIKTYGCQMNVHETEKMYDAFLKEGCRIASNIEDADIILYNTCCIREGAETRVLGNLGIAKKLKEKNHNLIIGICGCMSQQEGMAEYLHKRCPFINFITGTYSMDKIVDMVRDCEHGYFSDTTINETAPSGVNYATRTGVSSFINITYGCNNFCTYCIVPHVKGRERSRRIDDVISEAKLLIAGGTKEITLLGQNVNSYKDESGNDFYALMSELASLSGDFWIKFMTSHPKDLSKEVIRLIGREEKLASYIHLPLQSGSNRILREMNRRYTYEEYSEKLQWAREYIPSVGITGDIIVGFPDETEDDFEHTLSAVKSARYNNLFMFLYSKRTGTPAATMASQVPEKIKKERLTRLIALQSEIETGLAAESVGQTYKVLIDGDGKSLCGKTASDKPVVIEESSSNLKNSFAYVEITRAVGSKLYGVIKTEKEATPL